MGTSWTPARRAVAAVRGSPARHDLAVAEIEAASNLQVRRRTSILPRYTCPALTATVTVPARCARLAVPDAIAEQLAHQQGGVIPARVPGTEHPDCERAGDPCPLRPPGHRHALPDLQPSHQRTRLPRPPPPPANHRGRQAGCTAMHARLSGSRQAGTRDRRGPSVAVRGKPTVHTDRPGGRTPSAMCPWTPRHRDLQRYKVTHDGTEKKRPAQPRIPSKRAVFAGGGRSWVRTRVGEADGFTDRSLCGLIWNATDLETAAYHQPARPGSRSSCR